MQCWPQILLPCKSLCLQVGQGLVAILTPETGFAEVDVFRHDFEDDDAELARIATGQMKEKDESDPCQEGFGDVVSLPSSSMCRSADVELLNVIARLCGRTILMGSVTCSLWTFII